jgi:hypothetical protein
VEAWVRMLTDLDTVSGVTLVDVPTDDIVSEIGYKKVGGVDNISFAVSWESQIGIERFGQFASDSIFYANKYFTWKTEIGIGKLHPVLRSTWRDYSIWIKYDSVINVLFEAGAVMVEGVDAYKINDVLSAILGQLDSTITHFGSSDYSRFLYDVLNPVTGEGNQAVLISPITNITVRYDTAATKAEITLAEILAMLKGVYNCDWFIDSAKKFRIEHTKYFRNGGSYDSDVIGADLTTINEPRTEKKWGFEQNKYTYEKEAMPERINFQWANEVSEVFKGYPIIFKSLYVQKGNIQEINIARFVSDLDFILAYPNLVNKDDFMLLNTPVLFGSDVEFFDVVEGGNTWRLQNGRLSFVYLHDKFWRDNLAGKNININQIDGTANSVKRQRVQDVLFQYSISLDSFGLIKTGLGNGELISASRSFYNKAIKAKIKHDTEV